MDTTPRPYVAPTLTASQPFEEEPSAWRKLLLALEGLSNSESPYQIGCTDYNPPEPYWACGIVWTPLDWGVAVAASRQVGTKNWADRLDFTVQVGPFTVYAEREWNSPK